MLAELIAYNNETSVIIIIIIIIIISFCLCMKGDARRGGGHGPGEAAHCQDRGAAWGKT